MLPCRKRRNGCPKWFSKDLGLRTHLRTCSWYFPEKKQDTKVTRPLPRNLGGNDFRLPCDSLAFNMHDDSVEEEPLSIPEEPVENVLSIIEPLRQYSHLSKDEMKLSRILSHLSQHTGQARVDNIFSILGLPEFNLNRFLSTFCSAKDCMKVISSELETQFLQQGFVRKKVRDESTNVSYDIYLRSPVHVLREQIKGCSSNSTFFNPPSQLNNFCHPMMAELGRKGYPSVKDDIMKRCNKNAIWKTSLQTGEASFVGMMQMYSDKSQNNLKALSFQFYPVHLTLLNFCQEYRRDCLMKSLTFLAFLPLVFNVDPDSKVPMKGIQRDVRRRLIHQAMGEIMQELKDVAYEGFRCVDANNKVRRCHPALAANCCDLPEGKDMTSVKNGNNSLRNCHRCMAKTDSFNLLTRCNLRTTAETKNVIEMAADLKCKGKSTDAMNLLSEYSLRPQVPWLATLPFAGNCSTLDLHEMFSFEPLHNLQLGISKDLKKYLSERLKSDSMRTKALPMRHGNSRTCSFKVARLSILQGINRMLAHIQSFSPAKGLRIDFGSEGKSDYTTGLYGNDGTLAGMLEGKDYRRLDFIFPFVGMLVDRWCDQISTSPVTNLFVQYSDMVSLSLSYDGDVMWNEQELERLESMISKFKETAVEVFGDFSTSELRTEKFHLLDHVVQDMRRLGGLQWCHAGVFEYTHTMVKAAYRRGSKRKRNAMEATILNFTMKLHSTNMD